MEIIRISNIICYITYRQSIRLPLHGYFICPPEIVIFTVIKEPQQAFIFHLQNMRNHIRGASDHNVMNIIAAHYNELTERCGRLYRGGTIELCYVIHETILYVSTMPESREAQNVPALLDLFVYKFRMIAFETVRATPRTVVYLDSVKAKDIANIPDE